MIGLKTISTYMPSETIDNLLHAQDFGESEDFVRGKIGAITLPRKCASQETSDLAMLAVEALLKEQPSLTRETIDAIVLVTQNPDGEGLPQTSAILQHKLGLSQRVAAFDISLGCSGYVYGLYALKGFLEASGLKNGILVTADPYSKIVDRGDKSTSLLFGDAATATWLGHSPSWRFGSVTFGTDGSGAEFLKREQGILRMNGRQVFNFALKNVKPAIQSLLSKEGLSSEDIDSYCLHQGSAAIVDQIARQFPNVSERFVNDLTNTGNTVSSSIPLIMRRHVLKSAAARILLAGFGVGLSWGAAVLYKSEEISNA
jgi:3-oxoacyl-[acyl-carrier-protein] synthase-3